LSSKGQIKNVGANLLLAMGIGGEERGHGNENVQFAVQSVMADGWLMAMREEGKGKNKEQGKRKGRGLLLGAGCCWALAAGGWALGGGNSLASLCSLIVFTV
jgi:hypothetical protein